MARWCAAQSWPVHPLAPGRKTPPANCSTCRAETHAPQNCPCHAQGGWCHGFHAATTDPARLDAWWGSHPQLGVGVACGPAGLVIVDVDAHSASVPARGRLLPGIAIPEQVNLTGLASGFDTLALLAAYRGQPNPAEDGTTLRVRTPSGGLHLWYRLPPGHPGYRSSTGSSPTVALAWQVDIRASGGYIVAPTTRTPAGSYVPLDDAREPSPLPAWLASELDRTGHSLAPAVKSACPRPRRERRAPVRAVRTLEPLLAEVASCASVPQGAAFTEKLNRAAYTAGGLVAAGHLTEASALELLTEQALRARPGQERRIQSVIVSALQAGMRRPLHHEGRS
ncbi:MULTISPECIES: bifunctional DNA primase/polymerase [unclassified Streptomyces]|uniref:bifunctional DNA primase/polymerase n=1 Tax=unclassified Streptomyces TaxID=2593676 RepID=UPI0038298101